MKNILKCLMAGIIILLPVFTSAQGLCPNGALNYIRVNIHYMLHDDGTGNFTEYDNGNGNTASTGYDYADSLIYLANYDLANNVQMNLPVGNTIPVNPIPFRYVLAGVYFHRDNQHYDYNNIEWSVHDKYGVNKGTEINVYMQYSLHSSGTGPQNGGVSAGIGPGTRNAIKITAPWHQYIAGNGAGAFAGTFNHEMGHKLGLPHSFSDNCADTDNSYQNTNNVMDYSFPNQRAWTPCQLSIATNNLQGGLSSYVSCCNLTSVFNIPSHFCTGWPLILDGSFRQSPQETGYTLEIFKTDKIGGTTQVGGYWTQTYTGQYGQIYLSNLYTFEGGNIYCVKLTATNACGSSTSIKYVYKIIAPAALFFQNQNFSGVNNYYTLGWVLFGSTVDNFNPYGPYTVSSPGVLTVKTKKAIFLDPGTSFQQGSVVSLSVNTSMECPGNNYTTYRQAADNNTAGNSFAETKFTCGMDHHTSNTNVVLDSPSAEAEAICNIYPNPSDGSFTVGLKVPFTITISNPEGKVIYSGSFPEGLEPVITLEGEELTSGVFYAKIITMEKTYNQKIVFLK
jgi:hypothetical protein